MGVRGWEQQHDQEGKIYFTKSEDGLLAETWNDPQRQDSWDKFQRARQQNRMQIKRPHDLSQASPQTMVQERQTTCKRLKSCTYDHRRRHMTGPDDDSVLALDRTDQFRPVQYIK